MNNEMIGRFVWNETQPQTNNKPEKKRTLIWSEKKWNVKTGRWEQAAKLPFGFNLIRKTLFGKHTTYSISIKPRTYLSPPKTRLDKFYMP
jgi:hypothetical protein